MTEHKALVVEGGAMRGIFTTGLLDEFLEKNFNPFSFYCGVSAGALNLSAYLSGMKERNLKLYTEFATRPEFMSMSRFIKGGHLLDMDWLFRMMNEHVKLDHHKIAQHKFHIGITDVQRAHTFFEQAKENTLEKILQVSSTLPILYRGLPRLNGHPMTDGGMMNAIPIRHAIEQGATQIMVVRSRLKDYRQRTKISDHLLSYVFRRSPELANFLKFRSERYNETLELMRNPPEGVKILEVCPPEGFKMGRLDRGKKVLFKGYEQGRDAADDVIKQWQDLKPNPLLLP